MWIDVKEQLPRPGVWVVVCIEQHNTPQCLALATYNEETGKWYTDDWEDGERETYRPDYWMEIPEHF